MWRGIIAAGLLAAQISIVLAACPAGTRYDCKQTFSGKVVCGCR